MRPRELRPSLGLLLVVAACTSPTATPDGPGAGSAGRGGGAPGEGGSAGEEAGSAGNGPGGSGGGPTDAELADRARAVLFAHCSECHRGITCGSTSGGFGTFFDVEAMIACENVVPGSAEASRLWRLVRDREMPPDAQVPAADREAIKAWIDAGAPEPADELRGRDAHASRVACGNGWGRRAGATARRPGRTGRPRRRDDRRRGASTTARAARWAGPRRRSTGGPITTRGRGEFLANLTRGSAGPSARASRRRRPLHFGSARL